MADTFTIKSTSKDSATVGDVWLNPPEDEDSASTRRIARTELVDNIHSKEARVKLTIVHQRRHKKNEPWQDCTTFNCATLKGGEEMKLSLGAAETLHLHEILTGLHRIAQPGIPQQDANLTVVDESEAVVVKGRAVDLVRQLNEESSEEFWDAIKELKPYLFKSVALMKLHEVREEAVAEFENHLRDDDWYEGHWQQFFERNTWIFGYGLSYRFLSTVTPQPNYGGTLITGRGGQRGDYLTATESDYRFTVLVEIKRPNTSLVVNTQYRNGVSELGKELTGAVSQIQTNCRTWEIEGSRTDGNREAMLDSKCYTIKPKGYLVIGHTSQLTSTSKRHTFELFRQNLQNPDILTFDELLGRARHLLLAEAKELAPPLPAGDDWDDI